jgi:hypothetical protein
MQKQIIVRFLLVLALDASAFAQAPVITQQPADVKSIVGGSVQFSVGVAVLTDGGFEQASDPSLGAPIPGWTTVGTNYSIKAAAQGVAPIEGRKTLAFNSGNTPPNATISQTFATAAGTSYQVSFGHGVLGAVLDQRATVTVSNTGGPIIVSNTYTVSGTGNFASVTWTTRQFTFTAASSSTTIAIRDATTNTAINNDQYIDDVQVLKIGASDPTFQWYRSPSILLTGETSSVLDVANVTGPDSYYCVVTDPTRAAATTSNIAHLTILPPLSVDVGTGGNPRYFTDGNGNSVYLTGVHNPGGVQDWQRTTTDYDQFIADMVSRNHNFTRLWCHDQPNPKRLDGINALITPQPFLRVLGFGNAQDGGLKFDLSQLDDTYFSRLSSRVKQAGSNGIYVGVMISCPIVAVDPANFRYSMYRNGTVNISGTDCAGNNVNSTMSGLTDFGSEWTMATPGWSSSTTYGKGEIVSSAGSLYQSLQSSNLNHGVSNGLWWVNVSATPNNDPHWVGFMDTYIDRVVDTVNQYDNVVYEVGNEGFIGTSFWQDHVIGRIRAREAGKPKQHPIGKTAFAGVNPANGAVSNAIINDNLLAGPADWISFAGRAEPGNQPVGSQLYAGVVPDAPATKVSILDTDHVTGFSSATQSTTLQQWVWKCLTRGHNPLYITPGFGWPGYNASTPNWVNGGDIQIMKRLGWAHTVADRCHLRRMTPDDTVSDTGFALTNPNWQYLVYQPNNGSFHLTLPKRTFSQEWIDPNTGNTISKSMFTAAGGSCLFDLPAGYASALLYLENFCITSIGRGPSGDVTVQGQGIPGLTYTIEVSPDPSSAPFARLTSVVADSSGNLAVHDTDAAAMSGRFYCVRNSQ